MRKFIAALATAAAMLGVGAVTAPPAAAATQSYGNIRNGGTVSFWTEDVRVWAGYTSLQCGDSDANYVYVPSTAVLYLWRIAYRSDGSAYWAWVGTFNGVLALGNTSYYGRLA